MRLFVLDNDEHFRTEWAGLLRDRRHKVREAGSTHEKTPARVHRSHYDLAVIDLRAEDDERGNDRSGQDFATELCKRGTPAIILTSFPLSAEEMAAVLRSGAISGFVLKSIGSGVTAALIEHYGRYRKFPNGIATFTLPDEGDLGPNAMWESVRDALSDSTDWRRPPFEEFAVLFRALFSPCATRVTLRRVGSGQGGAALLRAEVSTGDGPVVEDLAVKFGQRSLIEDEAVRYDRYVGPLPDGAAAQLRYRAETEHLAAIAYSWVGDSVEAGVSLGPSKAVSATDMTWYRRRETAVRLFSRTLNAWYRVFRYPERTEARVENNLVRYYLGARGLWLHGLSSLYDLDLPLGLSVRTVSRTEWDFGTGFPQLMDPRLWAERGAGSELSFSRQCPCHGDLHVRNVYVLPDGSPRLIDFGRTSLGHIFRDFAAIEASLRLTCVETTGQGKAVDCEVLAGMEDIVCAPNVTGLADHLNYRAIPLDSRSQGRGDDVREAIRSTMEIRRAALDAAGNAIEKRSFEQYLFAVVVHMLRYAAGKCDEDPQPKATAQEEERQEWQKRQELRTWHALYAAARAATQADRLAQTHRTR